MCAVQKLQWLWVGVDIPLPSPLGYCASVWVGVAAFTLMLVGGVCVAPSRVDSGVVRGAACSIAPTQSLVLRRLYIYVRPSARVGMVEWA